MKTLHQLVMLCRPYYSLAFVWPFVLTVYYARGSLDGIVRSTAFAAAAMACVVAGGYALNDICDRTLDSRAGLKKPLTSGGLGTAAACVFTAVLFLAGMILACFASKIFTASLAAVAVGLVFYNVSSKRLGAAKPLIVALLVTAMYPMSIAQAASLGGPLAKTLPFFAAWIFAASWAYEIYKDIRDRKADAAFAAFPSPVQARPLLWQRIAAGAVLATTLLLIGPAFEGCGWRYDIFLPVSFLLAALPLFACRKTQTCILLLYAQFVFLGVATTLEVIF